MTAGDLVASALRLIGVLAASETPTSGDLTDAMLILNSMLDRWSTNGLVIFDNVIETFPLTTSQQAFTIGTGGNFNTTRPVNIQNAGIQIISGSTTSELPIEILNFDQWSAISVKNIQSTIPRALYLEDSFPLSTINLWPVPSVANNLVLYSQKPLTAFATATTTISLPPGFAEALRFNLAMRLAPEYGKQPREDIAQIAMQSLGDLKRLNSKPVYLRTDDALKTQGSTFNWLTGM